MKSARLLAALLGAAMMTGCGTLGGGEEPLQTTQGPQGSEFTRALAQDYQDLAAFEKDQSYDWHDASYYATKASRAADGQVVPPSDPALWSIRDEAALNDLETAHGRLLAALESGRAEKPEAAARAQTQYDCWVEEQQEGWQMQNIQFCREQFETALAELERPIPTAAAPTATPPAAPEPELVKSFLVFFDFDKDQLTPEAEEVLRSAVASVDDWTTTQVVVTGHADRAGPPTYNMQLSERRAQSVADALEQLGVSQTDIETVAEGEAQPLVPTGDGVAEPQNRRVQIELR